MEAFNHYKLVKRETQRFQQLIQSMKDNYKDQDYLTCCLLLINSLLNSCTEISSRVSLQKEFIGLGLKNFVEVYIKFNNLFLGIKRKESTFGTKIKNSN